MRKPDKCYSCFRNVNSMRTPKKPKSVPAPSVSAILFCFSAGAWLSSVASASTGLQVSVLAKRFSLLYRGQGVSIDSFPGILLAHPFFWLRVLEVEPRFSFSPGKSSIMESSVGFSTQYFFGGKLAEAQNSPSGRLERHSPFLLSVGGGAAWSRFDFREFDAKKNEALTLQSQQPLAGSAISVFGLFSLAWAPGPTFQLRTQIEQGLALQGEGKALELSTTSICAGVRFLFL
jgi:hypothetical protein